MYLNSCLQFQNVSEYSLLFKVKKFWETHALKKKNILRKRWFQSICKYKYICNRPVQDKGSKGREKGR